MLLSLRTMMEVGRTSLLLVQVLLLWWNLLQWMRKILFEQLFHLKISLDSQLLPSFVVLKDATNAGILVLKDMVIKEDILNIFQLIVERTLIRFLLSSGR